ncbi:hypothetical protein TWF225_010015 [Orbilia oligospora]|uniref:Uncharacterized protein n=1 Tax=Orbilia oligospora TaxID=2813651 RepID=A0A7C8KCQ1_ORBOL|nr:hypothetical protein TWF751_001629 [Orbilia oligospora]KAF3172729.1 hypothetical protein TWF225_010015 [Orbilia oligospora]KAF3271194.1 hypothetical protein TWF217_005604 [Orbilia oligospora]KAF3271743.1 hypothetical protein TWF128_000290 [Orbilia oligospora]TGJ72509.1 hypothetical protein EYR41_004399 [Orbilia oligospora]
MASFAQLPEELRRLLETVTAPFASTATKFLEAIPNPEQHFARACEILITLTTVNGPGGVSGGGLSGGGGGDWRPMEKNIGFRLNATFMLYWLYKEHDIHVNPFRSHFLEACEADKGRYAAGEKESAVERLKRARCKMLLAILGGEGSKLSDLSAKDFYHNFEQLRVGESADLRTFADEDEFPPISAWAPRQEQHQHQHHHHQQQQQQRQQGGANGYHGNSRQRAAGTPSPAPVQRGQPVFAQNYPPNHPSSSSSPLPYSSSISSSANRNPHTAAAFAEETTAVPNAILARTATAAAAAAAEDVSVVEDALTSAHIRNLNASERNMLRANIETAAKVYKAEDPEAYRRMLDLNFDILQLLTVEILKNNNNNDPQQKQKQQRLQQQGGNSVSKKNSSSGSGGSGGGSSGGSRQLLLDTILPRLNLELRSLDLINNLVYRPAKDEPQKHPPNTSTFATSQNDYTKHPPILTIEERTRLLHVFTSNCIRQLEVSPYGDSIDGIPANTARRTNRGPDVGRKVKLVCMFITNLLTREIVSSQEMYYEMQDLYMGFTNFKEAKELWTNATGGRGVGVGIMGV